MVSERKTPILLRPGGLSGEVYALYRYTRKTLENGRTVLDATGKQSVQADFDALLLEILIVDDTPDIVGILDGVADNLVACSMPRRARRCGRSASG